VTAARARERQIAHFTHVDNLTTIIAQGALSCDSVARQGQTRVEVGDTEIKEARRLRPVPVGPGGFVGDYVPFYFGPRSPMMFRIACDHRDEMPGRYPGGDRPLAYLVTTAGSIADAGLGWVGTDGNAAAATSRFCSALPDLNGMVDWPLMAAERWNNIPEDPDRQRRRMAEFLVHRAVPLALITLVAAYDAEYAAQIGAMLAGHALAGQVVVRPGWYYGYGRR
jgi:hypothetical protein